MIPRIGKKGFPKSEDLFKFGAMGFNISALKILSSEEANLLIFFKFFIPACMIVLMRCLSVYANEPSQQLLARFTITFNHFYFVTTLLLWDDLKT